MSISTQMILEGKGLVVEHFELPLPGMRPLFVTFSAHGNRRLDGFGFGGDFLLGQGFDLLAFKSTNDAWFSELEGRQLALLTRFRKSVRIKYSRLVAYGSSMGGYGAIKLSRTLDVDEVIAISPQSDIWAPWEHRWEASKSRMIRRPRLEPGDLSDRCRYHLIYDSRHSQDAKHVGSFFCAELPNVHCVGLPYTGHPSGRVLNEAQLLKPLVLQVAQGQLVDMATFRAARRDSGYYWIELAAALLRHRHADWAVEAAHKAVEVNPSQPQILKRHERILNSGLRLARRNLQRQLKADLDQVPVAILPPQVRPSALVVTTTDWLTRVIQQEGMPAGLSKNRAVELLDAVWTLLREDVGELVDDRLAVLGLGVFLHRPTRRSEQNLGRLLFIPRSRNSGNLSG